MEGIVTIMRVVMNDHLLQMLQLELETSKSVVMTVTVTKPIDRRRIGSESTTHVGPAVIGR